MQKKVGGDPALNKKIQGETYTVDIHRLDEKGSGQAVVWRKNEEGNERKLKLTIPYTLPGEKVRVTVEQPQKRRWKSKSDEVLEKHAERIMAKCPHFELCGGCVWQHFSYEGQLEEKTNQVRNVLQLQGFDPSVVNKTIGMDEPWYYRNKMEFTFAADGSLGLHEQGNFRNIIPLETCFIMKKEMKDAVLEVAKWAKENELTGYEKEKREGLLRHLMVRMSFKTNEIMLAIFATEAPSSCVEELVHRIQKYFPQVKSLLWLENRNWADRTQAEETHLLLGRDFIYDELMGFRYRLWFDTFFQTNPVQAEKLVKLALEMAEPNASEKMIDLFCGVGTFSLPFANQVKKLAGIELVETSIQSAKRNASDNGMDNTYFLAKDARHGMDEVLTHFGKPDLLLVDPPRSGAGGKVMRRIGRSAPERIIYVSCNPASFATDIKELEPFGYTLKKVQPVDLFPHTYHVELVALLSRVEE
ncbi:23S rRNA (uracil(1939)-C(5))-methyltransferase RlmD [Pseudogracilibacillus auburnensis]|nr:23S rRNA (uracil(1939)-C(5))-methyltransferase RlmD [Pseudogracilibacillus auburnensis]